MQGVKTTIRATKVGFKRFLAEPALGPVIEDAVKRMTYISFEASRLANMFVLHHLENNLPVPALSYGDFMRQPFQAVIRHTSRGPHVPKDTTDALLNHIRDTVYAQCRPQGMEWTDGR